MRRGRVFLSILLAASVALPTASDARPRLFGALSALMGGMAGLAVGHHYYRQHHRAIARHDSERPVAAEPQPVAEKSPAMQLPPPPASLANLPAADFGTTEDQFFGYVVAPASYDTKFWAHGERDMIQAVFTKGSTAIAPNCGETSQQRADPLIERIAQTTHPNDEQRVALQSLQAALVNAFDRINTTCRDVDPITPTARLKAMQERLFAIRDSGLSIRTSLAAFYDMLSDEQKTQFNAGDVTGDITGGSDPGAKPKPVAPSAMQVCEAQAQAAYAWPTALIGRRVRPTQQQGASLAALQKTLFGMAMYLKGACPNETTPTPVARLDAAMRRIDGMLYAVIAISPALDDFYGQLSDTQKARFNSIDRAST